jgi:polyribonucleotide nucleotidyltransferase
MALIVRSEALVAGALVLAGVGEQGVASSAVVHGVSGKKSPYAPRVESIQINPEKIGAVIGKGGEMIQKITEETGAEIDIKDDGTIFIASPNGESIEKAKTWIGQIVAEPEVGKIYEKL